MSVTEKIKMPNKEIVQPKKMGLLVENPVYKPFRYPWCYDAWLTQQEKDVFKTAFELNQNWIIELSGDRTPFISQAQSINLFLPADVHKKELHRIHFDAWKKGLKSLYYCRSKSIQRAENINNAKSTDVTANVYKSKNQQTNDQPEYEECLSCQ